MLGCLMYAVQCSRPDLCYAVSYLCRFQNCADENLYKAIKRVLRYVQNTIDLKLIFTCKNNSDMLCCYVDSDWGSDLNSRKSTSGFFISSVWLYRCLVIKETTKSQSFLNRS